jgi:hypothetical protein
MKKIKFKLAAVLAFTMAFASSASAQGLYFDIGLGFGSE